MPGTLNVGGHDIITHSGDAGAGDVTVNVQDRLVLDSSGNVGIGTSSPNGVLELNHSSSVAATSKTQTGYPNLIIKDSSGSTSAEQGAAITFEGVYGALAKIAGVKNSDATSGSFRDFGNLVFYVNGNSSENSYAALNEAMRIDSSGKFLYAKTSSGVYTDGVEMGTGSGGYLSVSRNSDTGLFVHRNGTDGSLVVFAHASSNEGTISVSGTTVSYNGGHLSRWSQLADNTRDESIVKGTVMSNLDQMAEWTNDGVTEDNEQLNCMKVSDVEGDPNVAGVFVNWDNDDDIYTNDMNIAMTGDMVIRIAQATTVQRGDLLMSAGDGTAKPQGDDIVRSKTIAKVTSTHISHTYEDGSYLVPCVLMAC